MSDTEIVEALRTESQEGTEKLAITFADQYDGIASDQIEVSDLPILCGSNR